MTPELVTAWCAGIATIIVAVGTVVVNVKLNKALNKISSLEKMLSPEEIKQAEQKNAS